MILIDQVNEIARSSALIDLLMAIHDETGSSILMVGEERVAGVLQRHQAFFNRMNHLALVHLSGHSAADVQEIIRHRCEVTVDAEVCAMIHQEAGAESMRSVLVRMNDMEGYARTNDKDRITPADFRRIKEQLKVLGTRQPASAPAVKPDASPPIVEILREREAANA